MLFDAPAGGELVDDVRPAASFVGVGDLPGQRAHRRSVGELGDFNGLDTYLHILTSLESTLVERFKPTVTLRNLVAAGRLGRKTGDGIYRYDAAGKRVDDGAV